MEPLEQGDKPTLLVVDDTPENMIFMVGLLKERYKVKVAHNGPKALLVAASSPPPDLILLDVMMPEMDGYEVCQRLKSDPKTQEIPVIFLSSKGETEDQLNGFRQGAVDYLTKPIDPHLILEKIRTHLAEKMYANLLREKNALLEMELTKQHQKAMAIQDASILAMSSLVEKRDARTGNHIRRIQFFIKRLAHHLKNHPRFSHFLTDTIIDLLFRTAPLHDIGKMAIPDHILLKPGRLLPEEFEIMKRHPSLGHDAIEQAEKALEIDIEFLRIAKEIALHHQEKWDGTGYPEGLAGDKIPISARLMSLVDVYDTLIGQRVYKDRVSHEKACEIIVEARGRHFDPDIVDAFVTLQEEFRLIAQEFADSAESSKKGEH